AVLGLNEAILRETDQEVVRKYAADVDNAGQLLLSLINDILDFSKLEAGKMNIVPVNYNIKEVITSCCQMISEKVERKGLKLELAIDENLPSVMNGDEVRVRQIIMNLLSNAVKYTKEGKIKLSVREMAKNEKKSFVKDDSGRTALLYISVSDTGQGIKPSDREHLFESFTRIDELKNKNIEGTGLGLAITKHLVQLMYGEIAVTSTYGVGSCFIVKLPQEIVDARPIGQVNLLEGTEKKINVGFDDIFKAPGARLLVVDDVPSNLVVVTSLLKYTQMDIDTASSGDEAIDLCRKKAYHVILLDHMMPGRDGIETLRILKKDRDGQNHRTPVIMLSANAMAGAGEKYMMEGFDDYLSKPITAKRLEEKLLKYIPEHMVNLPEKNRSGSAGQNVVVQPAQEGALIDIPTAMKYCGDDMEILKAVAGAFLEDDRREELLGLLEKGDMQAYSIVIHGIKSASKSIGASTVSERARELEMLAKEGDVDTVRAKHGDFVKLYEQLFEEIRNL
ncbi:MAG: response regulator, partial [Lachnospiraceae bacterium]|nr:response regulator [Lachnospiraceae bacterium]